MNKYLQFMENAKHMVEKMIEKDIESLLSNISTETHVYSFRFHAGAWDWMCNGKALVLSNNGYAHCGGEERVADDHTASFQEIDRALVSLVKDYNFCAPFKTINAPKEAPKCVSVAEEKAKFLKCMSTLSKGLEEGHFAPKPE